MRGAPPGSHRTDKAIAVAAALKHEQMLTRKAAGWKQCPRCPPGTLKSLTEFGPQASAPDGHSGYCRVHAAEYARERRTWPVCTQCRKQRRPGEFFGIRGDPSRYCIACQELKARHGRRVRRPAEWLALPDGRLQRVATTPGDDLEPAGRTKPLPPALTAAVRQYGVRPPPVNDPRRNGLL